MLQKKRFFAFFSKLHIPLWLFLLLCLVLLLRIPSFFEPYYYGDEMIYLTLGQGIRRGITLYKSLHDNKPPMLYLMAALGGNLFWFKVILASWCMTTTIVFWKFVQRMFAKREVLIKVSTFIFALLTTLPTFEGNIANAELFMIGPSIMAFYIILFKKDTLTNKFIAGLLFSLAALFKIPAAFDILAIFFFFLLTLKLNKESVKKTFLNLFAIAIGFILPILGTLVYYYLQGAFSEYLIAAFLQNFGYLSSWKPKSELSFWDKNSALLIRFAIALIGSSILIFFKKKLNKYYIFLFLWILWGGFAVALSERPYPHYFVQILAPVSIFLGLFFTDKSMLQTLSLIPLLVAFSIPYYFKFWSYPCLSYYQRFINLITSRNKDSYIAKFDKYAPTYYKLAQIIRTTTKPDDKIFVWGDSATLYALSRRTPSIKYTVEYHINDFSSHDRVMEMIELDPPREIIFLPNSTNFPELLRYAKQNYFLIETQDNALIWKKLNDLQLQTLK